MSNLSAGVPREIVTFAQQKYNLKEFIETGTFRGESAAFAATLFDYVLTIEIDKENFATARERLFEVQQTEPIECWYGDSRELMSGAMAQLSGRAFIWLDAHNVAGQFGDEDSCPVIEELFAINQRPQYHHIIVIDDAHCFHPPLPMHLTPEAWPTIQDIARVAAQNGYEVHVAHDLIILAVLHEMQEIVQFLGTLPTARNALMRRLTCSAEAINGPMKQGAVPAALPAFTGMTWTNYGWMLVHRFDSSQTAALTQVGISRDHEDIELLSKHLKGAGYGAVFVDIGANVGAYSFGVRRFCAEVHAFEPQRIIFNMICGSIALNGWQNVYSYNVALGAEEGKIEIPQFDYNKQLSFGSIEFGANQKEPLSQVRKHDAHRQEYVPLRKLDSYAFQRIDVMKIDVEGMEADVLAGARDTILRCRPVILIEHGKSDRAVLQIVLESLGYGVQEYRTFDFLCIPLIEE